MILRHQDQSISLDGVEVEMRDVVLMLVRVSLKKKNLSHYPAFMALGSSSEALHSCSVHLDLDGCTIDFQEVVWCMPSNQGEEFMVEPYPECLVGATH